MGLGEALRDATRVVRILDVGCGVGNAAAPLLVKAKAKVEYVGLDVSKTAVGILKEKLEGIVREERGGLAGRDAAVGILREKLEGMKRKERGGLAGRGGSSGEPLDRRCESQDRGGVHGGGGFEMGLDGKNTGLDGMLFKKMGVEFKGMDGYDLDFDGDDKFRTGVNGISKGLDGHCSSRMNREIQEKIDDESFIDTNSPPRLSYKLYECDVASDVSTWENCLRNEQPFDFALCIFTLSAIQPEHMENLAWRTCQALKPGTGTMIFRDYGRGDLAQTRFPKGQKLARGLFTRQDGTLSFFFTPEGLMSMMEIQAGARCVFLKRLNKSIENRAENLTMNRAWLGAEFVRRAS